MADREQEPEKISRTLGLARVSTWRVQAFREEAESLLERHGVIFDEVKAGEIVHGGESVTDVSVEFRSEMVAEMAKEKLDGEMVGGRKLQVKYV